jgi:hypothetical protein
MRSRRRNEEEARTPCGGKFVTFRSASASYQLAATTGTASKFEEDSHEKIPRQSGDRNDLAPEQIHRIIHLAEVAADSTR